MDKATATKLADALTWARVFSIVPIAALAWYFATNDTSHLFDKEVSSAT